MGSGESIEISDMGGLPDRFVIAIILGSPLVICQRATTHVINRNKT